MQLHHNSNTSVEYLYLDSALCYHIRVGISCWSRSSFSSVLCLRWWL